MKDFYFAEANSNQKPLWFRVVRQLGTVEMVVFDFLESDRMACDLARALNAPAN